MHDTLTDAQPITAPLPVAPEPMHCTGYVAGDPTGCARCGEGSYPGHRPAYGRPSRPRWLAPLAAVILLVAAPVAGWIVGTPAETVRRDTDAAATPDGEVVLTSTTVAVRDPGAQATTTTGADGEPARGPVAHGADPASSSAPSQETRDELATPAHTTPTTAATAPGSTTTTGPSTTLPPETVPPPPPTCPGGAPMVDGECGFIPFPGSD